MREEVIKMLKEKQKEAKQELDRVNSVYMQIWDSISEDYYSDFFEVETSRSYCYTVDLPDFLKQVKVSLSKPGVNALEKILENDGFIFNENLKIWVYDRVKLDRKLAEKGASYKGLQLKED